MNKIEKLEAELLEWKTVANEIKAFINPCALEQSTPADLKLQVVSEIEALRAENEKKDLCHMKTTIERDHYYDLGTELAELVGRFFGFDVGEHSSTNCPVLTAVSKFPDMNKADKEKQAIEKVAKEYHNKKLIMILKELRGVLQEPYSRSPEGREYLAKIARLCVKNEVYEALDTLYPDKGQTDNE